jgi:hypothetical protein
MNDDEYINLCCKMILGDYEDSPYDSFLDYWTDHWEGWGNIFEKPIFHEIQKSFIKAGYGNDSQSIY